MSEDEKKMLDSLLDKLYESRCYRKKYNGSTCFIDCPYYINGAYGGECAIEIVQDELV